MACVGRFRFAYLTDGTGGFVVIDVEDPTDPVKADDYNTTGEAYGLFVRDEDIYVVDRYAGLFLLRLESGFVIGRREGDLPVNARYTFGSP